MMPTLLPPVRSSPTASDFRRFFGDFQMVDHPCRVHVRRKLGAVGGEAAILIISCCRLTCHAPPVMARPIDAAYAPTISLDTGTVFSLAFLPLPCQLGLSPRRFRNRHHCSFRIANPGSLCLYRVADFNARSSPPARFWIRTERKHFQSLI